MKWFLVIPTLLVFLFSCQKEHNLGEDYNKLIGTWGNINGDDSVTLILKKNGGLEYHRSFHKNRKFQINSFEIYNQVYLNYEVYKLSGKKDVVGLCISATFDTLFVINYDDTQNFYFDYDNQSYLVKKP